MTVSPAPVPRLWLGQALSRTGDMASDVAVVVLAAHLAPRLPAQAIALAATAYVLPGMVAGAAAARLVARLAPKALIAGDAMWRASYLAVIAMLAAMHSLSLPAYVSLLAAASLTRAAGFAGETGAVRALVSSHRLLATNSLLATTDHMAAIIGPFIAGIIITIGSPQAVLLFDAGTFGAYAVVATTLPLAATGRAVRPKRSPPPGDWPKIIRRLLVLTAAFYLLYGPMVVALPLRTGVLSRGLGLSQGGMLGALWTGFGIGALLGAVMATRSSRRASERGALAIVAAWGAATVIVGASSSGALAVGAMLAGGLAYGPYAPLTATILQDAAASEADLLRMASVWNATTSGATPLGILLGGAVIPLVDAGHALIATGLIMIIGSGIARAFLPRQGSG